jgi:adenine-specific DNA-methyltransferase
MQLTDYHAKYFAYELTKRCSSDSLEKLAGAVAGAQVDLNPHQVDAALFAFNSPLSRGALLADEVGLGKTIEAGLVLSQKWAERKRRILIITPSNLRKQWYQEMAEKFFLPCAILEAKSYNAAIKAGNFRPFEIGDTIVICSYHFARSKAADVANAAWDLVVIDEAHRLRNVYKPSNVIANIAALQTAIDEDKGSVNAEKKSFGPAVKGWMSKMLAKVIDASWQIELGVAGGLLSEALKAYYFS